MARSFNGTTQQINCGEPNSPTAMTWACWVNPSAFTNAYSAVMCRDDSTSFVLLSVKSNAKLAIYIHTTGGLLNYDGTGSHTLTTSTWYHLALTYDSTNGIIGYVNGASDGTAAANGTVTSFAGGFLLYFSHDQLNANREFAGSIADGCQWNTALTAAEIKALSSGMRPYVIRPLSIDGYWPLDGLVSPEPDLSGHRNNGTLIGSPALAPGPPVTMFTPRRPSGSILPVGAGGAVNFRRSLSSLGTRAGSRQVQAA